MERKLDIDNYSLVEECLKGDKEALNLFYLRFAPRMLRVIRRYIHDDKDTEDILHDGFIVALTRLKSLRDPERVDYWLASIMKNLSLRFLQEQDVALLLHEENDVEDAAPLDNIIDMEVLESLIRKLPPGYQKVFRLSILENKSHKEIAKILGIAPNSSSSQLFHAKMMMRQLITDYKKQAGLLGLLLIGLTAGFLWLSKRVPDNALAPEVEAIISAPSSIASAHGEAEVSTLGEKAAASHVEAEVSSPEEKATASHVETEVSSLADNTAISIRNDEGAVIGAVEEGEAPDSGANGAMIEGIAKMDGPEPINHNIDKQGEEKAMKISDNHEEDNQVTLDNSGDENHMEMFKHLNNHRESSWGLVARAETGFRSRNVTNSEDPKFSSSGLDGFLTSSNISGVQRLRLPHKNDFPISFSLAVSRSLTKMIGLEAGLSYTYLSTTFEEGPARSHCHWHYLGIPVRLTFRSFQSGRFKLYGAVGGSVEVPLSSAASLSGSSASSIVKVMPNGSFSSPCVFTLTGSYGGAFKLSEKFELFVEPTLQLRLHNDAKVPNVWSDNTVGFSLPIGLRFNW